MNIENIIPIKKTETKEEILQDDRFGSIDEMFAVLEKNQLVGQQYQVFKEYLKLADEERQDKFLRKVSRNNFSYRIIEDLIFDQLFLEFKNVSNAIIESLKKIDIIQMDQFLKARRYETDYSKSFAEKYKLKTSLTIKEFKSIAGFFNNLGIKSNISNDTEKGINKTYYGEFVLDYAGMDIDKINKSLENLEKINNKTAEQSWQYDILQDTAKEKIKYDIFIEELKKSINKILITDDIHDSNIQEGVLFKKIAEMEKLLKITGDSRYLKEYILLNKESGQDSKQYNQNFLRIFKDNEVSQYQKLSDVVEMQEYQNLFLKLDKLQNIIKDKLWLMSALLLYTFKYQKKDLQGEKSIMKINQKLYNSFNTLTSAKNMLLKPDIKMNDSIGLVVEYKFLLNNIMSLRSSYIEINENLSAEKKEVFDEFLKTLRNISKDNKNKNDYNLNITNASIDDLENLLKSIKKDDVLYSFKIRTISNIIKNKSKELKDQNISIKPNRIYVRTEPNISISASPENLEHKKIDAFAIIKLEYEYIPEEHNNKNFSDYFIEKTINNQNYQELNIDSDLTPLSFIDDKYSKTTPPENIQTKSDLFSGFFIDKFSSYPEYEFKKDHEGQLIKDENGKLIIAKRFTKECYRVTYYLPIQITTSDNSDILDRKQNDIIKKHGILLKIDRKEKMNLLNDKNFAESDYFEQFIIEPIKDEFTRLQNIIEPSDNEIATMNNLKLFMELYKDTNYCHFMESKENTQQKQVA